MTNEEIYQIWRPEDSPWSQWVKPVVFSFLSPDAPKGRAYSGQEWKVELHPDTAIIVDLAGAEGVAAGLALTRGGYLPVISYNACPSSPVFELVAAPVVVDMTSILTALCETTEEFAALDLSDEAPPAFLLDRNRRGPEVPLNPGWFDNCSFVTSSDFPSADYFRSHGISRMILIQPQSAINPDLLQVLLRLQRDGMSIARQTPWTLWAPRPIVVERPMFFVSAWEWLCQKLGYRRNDFHGSFGGLVPPSSS